jgi:hypothetical protein
MKNPQTGLLEKKILSNGENFVLKIIIRRQLVLPTGANYAGRIL